MPRNTSPFREVPIPFLLIPGVNSPEQVLPDTAHIFHIKGIGQDYTTSCVVHLAKLGCWQGRSFDTRLSEAYGAFREFCAASGKSTGIDGFSKHIFDMTSTLG